MPKIPYRSSGQPAEKREGQRSGPPDSLPALADFQGRTEHLVDVVGNSLVLEWHGMRVVAQRGREIPVPEALLGPQQLAPSDEEGGHAVSQTVQRCSGDVGSAGELGGPMPEGAGRESDVMADSGEKSQGPKDTP